MADLIYIEADLGVPFKLMAARENFFVYGNWMGNADLAYLLENGEILTRFTITIKSIITTLKPRAPWNP